MIFGDPHLLHCGFIVVTPCCAEPNDGSIRRYRLANRTGDEGSEQADGGLRRSVRARG